MGLNQTGESSWCLQAEIWHGAARNIYEKKLLSMWWVCWEGIRDEGGFTLALFQGWGGGGK